MLFLTKENVQVVFIRVVVVVVVLVMSLTT